MTDSWSDNLIGSGRFLCTQVNEGLIPAVFLGRTHWPAQPPSPVHPTVTLGSADFSFEVWARRKFADSPGGDTAFYTGLLGTSSFGFPFAAIQWQNNADRVDIYFDEDADNLSQIRINNVTPDTPGEWTHYAVNYDRDGNMEVFLNNASKGTTAISAQTASLGSPSLYPLQGNDSSNVYDGNFVTWSGIDICPVVIGPIAVHNRLLTQAEIQESYLYQTVNRITGVTLVAYNWHQIEGETGWDTDLTHMINSLRVGLPVPGGAPEGVAGTVKALDISGNDNHWLLPVSASYSTTTATKYDFGFGGEQFFK